MLTKIVVARATTGEEEAQRYEAQRDDGVNARRVAHGAGAAAEKLAALLAEGNDVYFNGAGEAGLKDAAQSWSIDHTDHRYRHQNYATLEGIVRILDDHPELMLEVHGETGPAEHAPPLLADAWALHRTRDVQAIYDRLARYRASRS